FNDNGGVDTYANATSLSGASYPLQITTGLSNPTGSQDYTIRVYNGANSCYTDIVATLNEQNCSFDCACTEYIYLNEPDAEAVHKVEILPNGTLSEVFGGANDDRFWYPGDNTSELSSPHGFAVDVNGYLYIGETQESADNIRRLTCDGEIRPTSEFAIANTGFKQNTFSIGNTLYNNSNLGPTKWDLCTGQQLGQLCLGDMLGNTMAVNQDNVFRDGEIRTWGLTYNAVTNTIYVTSRLYVDLYSGGNKKLIDEKEKRHNVWAFTPEQMDAAIAANTCITPLIGEGNNTTLSAGENATPYQTGSLMGVVGDNAGNIYVVKSGQERRYPAGETSMPISTGAYILKYNAQGQFITQSAIDATLGGGGYNQAIGITYSPVTDKLYVSNFTNDPNEDCISIFDAQTLNYDGTGLPNPANGSGSRGKGISIATECCPTSSNITIDTTLCPIAINDSLFLQNLLNCNSTVCEGVWQQVSSSGIAYEACDNSVKFTATSGSGTFVLQSDGAGKKRCGAFTITVNITYQDNCTVCTTPTVLALAVPSTCTGNVANSDGSLRLSSVTQGDAYHWSLGNTFNDNGGANTYANATSLSGATYPLQIATGLMNPTGSQNYTIRVYNGANDCFTDVVVTMNEQNCPTDCGNPTIGNDQPTCTNQSGCLGGTTFEDYNFDGTNDTNEPGVGGVQIYVYDCTNTAVDSTISDSAGEWEICSLTDNDDYRIEFILPESIACWAKPTPVGANNNSSVQFVTAPTCTSFGLSSAADYCEANPLIIVPCFNAGVYNANGNNTEAALVAVDYQQIFNSQTAGKRTDATVDEVGMVWGTAYQKRSKRLFVATTTRRHSGEGERGFDGIYVYDYSTASVSQLGGFDLEGVAPANISNSISGGQNISLGTVTRVTTPNTDDNYIASVTTTPSRDMDAFDKVGRVGYGDIDFDESDNLLWLVNLNQRSLITIDISDYTPSMTVPANPSGTVNQYLLDEIPGLPTCSSGRLMPWGLEFHKGKGYLGVICNAETTKDVNDLQGYVLSFDPTNLASGFTTIVQIPMNYTREDWGANTSNSSGWRAWVDDWSETGLPTSGYGTFAQVAYPQPVISDIAFADNGDMIIGVMDRFSLQTGTDNFIPVSGTNQDITGLSNGDILHACFDISTSQFTLEDGATSCGHPDLRSNTNVGAGSGTLLTNDGPGNNGEYYFDDYQQNNQFTSHKEIALGSVEVLKGNSELLATVFGPRDGQFFENGYHVYNTQTAIEQTNYVIFDGDGTNGADFGKQLAIGDLQLLCQPAPLEIGNYVWCDSIANGIQDACERGIDGILVQLYDRNGNLIGQDTTAKAGQYYFNQNNVDTTGITVNGSGVASPVTGWSGISYATQYFIVFGDSQFATDEFTVGSDTYGITAMANAGSNDNIDSDVDGSSLTSGSLGSRPNGLPFIELTTAAIGCGDHQYDLGLTCNNCIVPTASIFAIQPACTNGVAGSDGYLQISEVTNGDRYHFSAGSTFDDNGGANDYSNATAFTIFPEKTTANLPNPSGSQDYTIRIYNGTDGCFTDVVVTMNELDCTAQCNCSDYVYANDVDLNETHKFRVNSDGSLTELLNTTNGPWSTHDITAPHGLGADLNGYLYISGNGLETGAAGWPGIGNDPIFKLNCDGIVIDPVTNLPQTGSPTNYVPAIPNPLSDGTFLRTTNYHSRNGFLYAFTEGTNEVVAIELCTYTEVGRMQLKASGNFRGWGFYIDDSDWYAVNLRGGTQEVLTGSLDINLYTSPATNAGSRLFALSGDAVGMTKDDTGNIYIIEDQNALGNQNNIKIVKYDSNGNFIDEVVDNTSGNFDGANLTNGQEGWWGTRGIVYSPEAGGRLYLGGNENCVTVFDLDLNQLVADNIGNPLAGNTKSIQIQTECCPTTTPQTIDTALCIGGYMGQKYFLNELFPCDGVICGGVWTTVGSISGMRFDACDQSITIESENACGAFTKSGGGTPSSVCGAFELNLNITVKNLTTPVIGANQSGLCPSDTPLPLTVVNAATSNVNILYQWQTSITDCTTGFTNVGSPTSTPQPYQPPAISTTTFYRLVVTTNTGCSSGECEAISNCVTLTADPGCTPVLYDWGDLPDSSDSTALNDYQTLSSNNGPVHQIISGLSLGATVDAEMDGQSSDNALGDGADEDAIAMVTTLKLFPGLTFRLPFSYVNTTGNTAHVEAWIDWNADGAFDGTSEMVIDWDDGGGPLPNRMPITIPPNATTGSQLGWRIRISNQDNMTPYGLQPNGEVEDYLIGIDCPQICLPVNIRVIPK
ncbi:MAG: SdrD B-like domain-containing protein, partial [Bacteroidota bacterium]